MGVVERRWRVVVVWLVVMVAASLAVIAVVPTNHQATGQILILPPSQPVQQGERINPYLNLPGSLTFTATLIASTVSDPGVARQLAEAGYESVYSVSVVPGTGPLIIVSVEDNDPQAATAMRDELLDRIENELATIQEAESVPTQQLMEARRFNVSTDASALAGNKIRALAVLAVVGVVVGVSTISALERRSARRKLGGSSEVDPATAPSQEQQEPPVGLEAVDGQRVQAADESRPSRPPTRRQPTRGLTGTPGRR